ncbi:hemagglutinin repeat-containing protein [Neisseria sp. GCM10028920]|uniref:hemagglutinin repeat-containing protein n=6 Tax=unclassified Neisseria TaxID=2623750 RepID=UPI0036216F53
MQGGGYSDSIVGNWMQRSSASAKASQAAGTPVVISGGRSRSTQTQDSSSTEAVGSSLTAGRHLSIRATEGSIEAKDAQISAEGDALLYASDDIRLLAAADSRRQTGSSKRSGFSIDNRDHITPFGTFNDQGQAAGEIGSISGSTLSVGGKTRLLAEKGNIAVSGSSLVSQDDLLLKAGGDIDIRAAEHRQSQSERQVSSGIGSAVISDTEHFSGWMKNRRENEGEETRQAASQIGSLKAGGDINIRSREGDITVQGSNITAGDTIRLDSARDILLQSAQDSQHQDGKNRNAGVQVGVGVSVGAQTGVYIYAEAAYGKGKNRSDSQTHQNTLLQSDKLQLSSKGNTVLNGAQAHAKRIDAEVGGTLHIESPQDTVEQESKQSGGGIRAQVALGTAWSVSGNYNQSKASGHSRSVGSQSGLFAGEGGYHIKADSVRLKGGAIASAADKDHNELTARSFSFEDIRNESSYSASSMGIGAGYGGSLKGSGGFNQSAFGRASQTAGQNIKQGLNYSPTLPQHESGGSQGYTRSVLSEGNITIGDQATSARALGIQTDLQNAHRSAEAVPDLQNLLDKQQTVAQSTAVIHSAVATYSGNRAKAAAEELEKQQAAYEGRLKEQNDGSYEQYAGKSDSERLSMRLGNAKYAQAYQEARSWGVGGSKSRALSAAETLITGALGGQGDLQLAANTLAPYAAAAIGKRFGHGENKNEAAQAIGHFMLGAALAYANGADPLAGGSAAVAAERAAGYLAKQYDDGHTAIDPHTGKFNPNLLPEHIKEEIKAQTGAIASVVGAAGGSLNGTNSSNGALFDAQVAGTVGQNAVENNAAGNSTSAVTRMQSRAATLENAAYAMDPFFLQGNVPDIYAEIQKLKRIDQVNQDKKNEIARNFLREHGINVPLMTVMDSVNGVGVVRLDTERNYRNLMKAMTEFKQAATTKHATFRMAKRQLGIPNSMQPTAVRRVPIVEKKHDRIGIVTYKKDSLGRTLFSTEYLFIVNGKGYVIQDHSVGHNFGDLNGIGNQHAHFNLKKLNLNTYTTNGTIDIETWKAEQNIPHNRQTYGISPITGIPEHLYTKPSPHADPKEHFFERIFNMKNGNRGKTKK